MNLLTVSNLYPRPDQPTRGLYNAQLFSRLAGLVEDVGGGFRNVCLVPEWRVSQWRRIDAWSSGAAVPKTDYIPVPYIPVVGRSVNAYVYAMGLKALSERMKQADLVYVSWLYPDGVAVARLAQKAAKPFWLMALGSDTFHLNVPARARQIVAACRLARGVVCVWQGLADRLIRAGVDANKIVIAPNGVDSSRFQFRSKIEASLNQDVSRLLTKAHDRPIVLFVGNLVEVKGPDLVVDMALRLLGEKSKNQPPLFALIGSGSMRRELEARVTRAGRKEDILFLGNHAHDAVARFMNASDCLCLTSRSEGMPNVVIEALASGLPVMATDVGAVSEMLTGEPGTWIVAPGSASTLADTVKQVLATTVDRPAMARRSAQRYSWDTQARDILGRINMP